MKSVIAVVCLFLLPVVVVAEGVALEDLNYPYWIALECVATSKGKLHLAGLDGTIPDGAIVQQEKRLKEGQTYVRIDGGQRWAIITAKLENGEIKNHTLSDKDSVEYASLGVSGGQADRKATVLSLRSLLRKELGVQPNPKSRSAPPQTNSTYKNLAKIFDVRYFPGMTHDEIMAAWEANNQAEEDNKIKGFARDWGLPYRAGMTFKDIQNGITSGKSTRTSPHYKQKYGQADREYRQRYAKIYGLDYRPGESEDALRNRARAKSQTERANAPTLEKLQQRVRSQTEREFAPTWKFYYEKWAKYDKNRWKHNGGRGDPFGGKGVITDRAGFIYVP